MRVSYWIAEPVRYMLVGPFTKETVLARECLAPYTPIRLVVEVSDD